MANENLITLNTAIKPYSRIEIAEKLKQLTEKKEKLNKRQQADLKLYLSEYYIELQSDTLPADWKSEPIKPFRQKNNHMLSLLPPVYAFGSDPFSISFRPIGGGTGYTNNNNSIYNSYFGGSLFMYGWNNIAIYANYRDAYQAKEVLAMPTYLTQSTGANYKLNNGNRPGGDFSEMRGGVTFQYKWFNLGLVKDHIQWGNNYNGSNILSGRTPSFPMFKLHIKPVKWFELNYFHGWLVSEEVDSARTYTPGGGQTRTIFREKYIAANFITIGPIKGVALSLGNSIIYSDVSVQPAYLIPFMFYKSIDHTLNHGIDNQNSQVFFDLSIRSLKHFHFYSSLYIDEFSFTRIADKDRHNFYSVKAGFKANNWPINNFIYSVEFTQSNPITYRHRVPALTFESNKFSLGHYLSDNSREYFATIGYKPIRGLTFYLSYTLAQKGKENPYIEIPGQPQTVDRYTLLDTITWESQKIDFSVSWEFAYNCRISAGYSFNNVTTNATGNQSASYYLSRFSPAIFQGKTNTISFGLNVGL